MKVAVLGAGGAGGYFGYRWAEAGLDVALIARGAHLRAIQQSGLSLRGPEGESTLSVPAFANPAQVGPVDLVVVATKTWQLPSVLDLVPPLLGEHTRVVGIQNGVEAAPVLDTVAPGRVLGGTCRIISYVEEPGAIRHVGIAPTLLLGERAGGPSAELDAMCDVLGRASGVTVSVSSDIELDMWKKFLFFAPVSGVGSVTRSPIGVFRATPASRRLLSDAMAEVGQIARARAVPLTLEDEAAALNYVDGLPVDGTSSMQRDFAAGRRTELEALSGAVVRLGAEVDVPAPTHAFLYAALLPGELTARLSAPTGAR